MCLQKGVALRFVIGCGNLSRIVSSNIYQGIDKPGFKPGHGVVLAYLILFLLGGSITTRFMLAAENKKRISGQRDS
jgi:hypothetical protein